jgi:succinate dehydrogenase flavin-adding protein (antitoxin of CptAB toxin-antitoxin module)
MTFFFVEESILYNYADDNTLSYSDTELNKIVDILEKESLNLIHWFSHNQMKANPGFNTFNCLEAFLHIFEI